MRVLRVRWFDLPLRGGGILFGLISQECATLPLGNSRPFPTGGGAGFEIPAFLR